MRFTVIILALLLCVESVALVEAAEPVPPTAAEIQTDYDSGKFADVTRKVARILALKGEQAKAFDRSVLLALKGEAHLHLRQSAVAMESFTLAAKESTDLVRASELRALAAIVKRSPGNLFQRKSTGEPPATRPAGIDIVSADSRKSAFAAMFDDDSPAVLVKVKAVRPSDVTPRQGTVVAAAKGDMPMEFLDLMTKLIDLRTIELLGKGDDTITRPALLQLAGSAAVAFADSIAKESPRVERIQSAATNRHALSNFESTSLRITGEFARRTRLASNVLASMTDDAAHQKNETDATQLADRVEQVLDADYGSAASTPRGPDNTTDDQRDRNGLPKTRLPGGGAGSVPGVGGIPGGF